MSLLVDVARALEQMKAHEMPSAHRLVWLMMAQHANDGRAWPSLLRLHHETGYGRTKLCEVIAELVEHGYLVPDGNVGEGLRRSARYLVRVDGRPWPEDSRASLKRSTEKASAVRAAVRLLSAARTAYVPPGGQVVYRPAVGLCTADSGSAYRPADTNLPGTHQINPPDQPTIAHAREHAEQGQGFAQGQGQIAIPFEPSRPTDSSATSGPSTATDPPKPRTTRKPAERAVEDPTALPPRERAAFDAIRRDPSLSPITAGAVQLAVDLCAVGPLVDVPREVAAAGAWMRADPSDPRRRKKKGGPFLLNWIERAQQTAAERGGPAPAPPPAEVPRRKPPEAPPVPKSVLAEVERIRAARARGEAVPTFEEVIKQLGDRSVAPIKDVA